MARVLFPEDVASGHVPNAESFAEVSAEIQYRLHDFPGISGVIQIGSVLRKDFDACSDMDVIVVYHRSMRGHILPELRTLSIYARSKAVPVEFIPFDREFAYHGAHTWTASFTSHVKWAEDNGGVICGCPVTPGMNPHQRGKSETLDYAVSKLQKVLKKQAKFPTLGADAVRDLLEEVVQVPLFLIRKRVWDKGIQLSLDSKKAVILAYGEVAYLKELGLFNELQHIAREYRELVVRKPDEKSYKNKVKELLQDRGLLCLTRFLEVTIESVIPC